MAGAGEKFLKLRFLQRVIAHLRLRATVVEQE
jgi:hypothetical protein